MAEQKPVVPLWVIVSSLSVLGAIGTLGGAFWRMGSMESAVTTKLDGAIADVVRLEGSFSRLESKVDDLLSSNEITLMVDARVHDILSEHERIDGHPVMTERVATLRTEFDALAARVAALENGE